MLTTTQDKMLSDWLMSKTPQQRQETENWLKTLSKEQMKRIMWWATQSAQFLTMEELKKSDNPNKLITKAALYWKMRQETEE